MDNQPALGRELLIPILIGGFSVVGLIVVLLGGQLFNAPAEIAATPSSTPFQYFYLGTEPAITTLVVEGSELPATEEPVAESPIPAPTSRPPIVLTRPNTATATGSVQRTNTPAPTSTSASGPPLNPGTYDDIDSHFVYSGAWESRTVAGAHDNTLHVSLAPGPTSTIFFRFIGREVRLIFQGGSTLGELTVSIDGEVETVEQSDGSEWVSDTFTNGTHTVVITHARGGSVNLDYVIIPEVPATPTRTATQN